MGNIRYSFAPGTRTNADANIAGAVCESLRGEGKLTAANLVEVSRPKDAPLHSAFDWNDAEAAEKWREQQARVIIGNLRVVIDGDAEPIKAYFNLHVDKPEYESLETILKREDDTELMLRNALRDLSVFRAKYGRLKALSNVFSAVDQLQIDIGA